MAKDKKARERSDMNMIAHANLIAVLVDTMRDVHVPPMSILKFLDGLERLNDATMLAYPAYALAEIIQVIRATVPVND